jgi:hypothetical protein
MTACTERRASAVGDGRECEGQKGMPKEAQP